MARDLSREELRILQLFSANVRALLKSKGLSQAQLGKGIAAKPSTVSRWLKCNAVPNAIAVVEIADFLDAPLDRLFGREPSDPTPKVRRCAKRILELTGGVDPARTRWKSPAGKKTKRKR